MAKLNKESINQLANEYVSVSSHDPFTTLKLIGQHAATMPELISAISQHKRLEKESANYLARSEEHFGTDKEGRFVKSGDKVLITLHGGGILTDDKVEKKIIKHYDWSFEREVNYNSRIFDDLLKGNLPNGRKIRVYSLEDVRKSKIPNIFREYAIWTDSKHAMKQISNMDKYPNIDLVESLNDYDFRAEEEYDKSPLLQVRSGIKNNLGLLKITGRCDSHLSTNYYTNYNYNDPLGNFLFLSWHKCASNDELVTIYPSVDETHNTAILRKSGLSGATLSKSMEKNK